MLTVFSLASLSQSLNTISPEDVNKNQALALFLLPEENQDLDKINLTISQFHDVRNKVATRKKNDQEYFLKWMYGLVHRKLLKRYSDFVTFSETLNNGKYDCLTGTAIFAMLLEASSINYEIMEFGHHLAIMVETNKGNPVLIESTDPIYGLVTDGVRIEQQIKEYHTTVQNVPSPNGIEVQLINPQMENRISLSELAGLHWFNFAAKHFNEGNFKKAHQLNSRAMVLYPESERIENLQIILEGLLKPGLAVLNN